MSLSTRPEETQLERPPDYGDYHPPRTTADRPIVDWDAAGAAVRNSTSFVTNWWDGLLGRTAQPQAPQPPR